MIWTTWKEMIRFNFHLSTFIFHLFDIWCECDLISYAACSGINHETENLYFLLFMQNESYDSTYDMLLVTSTTQFEMTTFAC